ncbi:hypothetical protein GCM10011371_13400 [Novosphingobium marinum]|uniref:Catechol 2,3-dioxygenase-like lactoylglutathione lyase family enzyme n=1 Tax=Novosphingobium marinum TaxID=1514948 RepID=A0A7Z0BUQ9_9SPHN|nr:VOC family protein [Novosphingobium marinum]NYH95448.1 catechol 2,3-dioxygenase-like lactoylglutathione lyase family enzyme [Novosphingobium marinum]GGC27141.1 hypothetical protein GCM10011371_13400 [Novosphingobium marinum]
MIRGIHHIALNTGNFDRMQHFYGTTLGFEQVGDPHAWANDPTSDRAIGLRDSAARQVFFKAGNVYLELFEYTNPVARDGEALRPCDRGYTHFAIDVQDIASEYARLSAAGMRFAAEEPCDFGPIKAVYGWDPDGNVIEIQQIEESEAASFEKLGDRAPA